MNTRLRRMADELALGESLVCGLDDRAELLDILTSPDRVRARQRLEERLGFPAPHAKFLLDMPLEVFTDENLRRLAPRIDELHERIREEEAWLAGAEPRPANRNLDNYGPNDVDEARRVLESIVRSVIRPDELEEIDVYWHVIPADLYPPRSGAGGELSEDFDAGDPPYLWIRIRAAGVEFCSNIWSPGNSNTTETIPWSEGVVHLADSLEDWVSEKVARGQQRRVDDDLLPGPG